jgi:hypothetical protein
MKFYRGERLGGKCQVTVDGQPLDPRIDLRSHTDEGFEWGYDGSGPRQLALAILADHFDDPATALGNQERFRLNFIAALRDDVWTLTSAEVDQALNDVVEVPMTLDQLLNKVRGTPES